MAVHPGAQEEMLYEQFWLETGGCAAAAEG